MKGGPKLLLGCFCTELKIQLINACFGSVQNTILNQIQTSQSHFLSSIAVRLQK